MKKNLYFGLTVFFLVNYGRIYAEIKAAPAVDAEKVLVAAENIRNPSEDYTCTVTLTDKKDGKKPDIRTYESSVKGRDKALVKFMTPATEKGTTLLMIEQDMWIKLPSSSKPARISANQKLTGNAAYGDVARLSFIGNYAPTFLRKDKLEGKPAIVLDLKSIDGRPVTYDWIEYWVQADNNRPLQAIYKTSSGKVIRKGTFANYTEIFGVQRPTLFKLVNSLKKDHTTSLEFSNNVRKTLPALMFEKQNLGRN